MKKEKKTHFFSAKDAGVQSRVDREEAEEKTAKSTRAVPVGHQGHCGLRADIFFRGTRPNCEGTRTMALVALVKFLRCLEVNISDPMSSVNLWIH